MPSTASAIKCAEECQKVDLPSASFHVSSLSEASFLIGLVASQVSPFTFAAITFLARPSLIDFAISNAVTPSSYCLTAPSGNVILIMPCSLVIFLLYQLLIHVSSSLVSLTSAVYRLSSISLPNETTTQNYFYGLQK